MSAHRLQNCFANWLSIDINDADVQQTVAHSLLIWAQLAIILTSCSFRSEVAQNSHASAHLMQASMQPCHFVFWSVAELAMPVLVAPIVFSTKLELFRSESHYESARSGEPDFVSSSPSTDASPPAFLRVMSSTFAYSSWSKSYSKFS